MEEDLISSTDNPLTHPSEKIAENKGGISVWNRIRERVGGLTKSTEKKEDYRLLDEVAKKVHADLKMGGYSQLFTVGGGEIYEADVVNQTVLLRGSRLMRATLIPVRANMGEIDLTSQELTLRISDVDKELGEGVDMRDLGLNQRRFVKGTKEKKMEDIRPNWFFQKVPGSGSSTHREFLDFCKDILGSTIDSEATRESYDEAQKYWQEKGVSNFKGMYWNKEQNVLQISVAEAES